MYYVVKIQPQVADTNMSRQIDYLAFSRWCDRARTRFYEELFPCFESFPHGCVVVNATVDYLLPMRVDDRVEVRTWTSRIGTKSFELTQEIWTTSADAPTPKRTAVSVIVFCAMNFITHKSEPLSEHFRTVLQKYEWSPDESKVADA